MSQKTADAARQDSEIRLKISKHGEVDVQRLIFGIRAISATMRLNWRPVEIISEAAGNDREK